VALVRRRAIRYTAGLARRARPARKPRVTSGATLSLNSGLQKRRPILKTAPRVSRPRKLRERGAGQPTIPGRERFRDGSGASAFSPKRLPELMQLSGDRGTPHGPLASRNSVERASAYIPRGRISRTIDDNHRKRRRSKLARVGYLQPRHAPSTPRKTEDPKTARRRRLTISPRYRAWHVRGQRPGPL
jgi:hypothetical protein